MSDRAVCGRRNVERGLAFGPVPLLRRQECGVTAGPRRAPEACPGGRGVLLVDLSTCGSDSRRGGQRQARRRASRRWPAIWPVRPVSAAAFFGGGVEESGQLGYARWGTPT